MNIRRSFHFNGNPYTWKNTSILKKDELEIYTEQPTMKYKITRTMCLFGGYVVVWQCYANSLHRDGKVVRVTALVFVGNIEACLPRRKCIPEYQSRHPGGFFFHFNVETHDITRKIITEWNIVHIYWNVLHIQMKPSGDAWSSATMISNMHAK